MTPDIIDDPFLKADRDKFERDMVGFFDGRLLQDIGVEEVKEWMLIWACVNPMNYLALGIVNLAKD